MTRIDAVFTAAGPGARLAARPRGVLHACLKGRPVCGTRTRRLYTRTLLDGRLCRRCLSWAERRYAPELPGAPRADARPALSVEELRCSILAATSSSELDSCVLAAMQDQLFRRHTAVRSGERLTVQQLIGRERREHAARADWLREQHIEDLYAAAVLAREGAA